MCTDIIHNAIILIDTCDNAWYNQVHWLIRTPYLSIKVSNGFEKPLLLPPANEVCEGYVFTGVCLSTGGVSAPLHAGIHPPGPKADTPPLPETDTPLRDQRQTPPWDQRKTPPPRDQRQTPPGRRPPGQTTPLDKHPIPPPQCMLGYGQQVGGTHPTGMHSSLVMLLSAQNVGVILSSWRRGWWSDEELYRGHQWNNHCSRTDQQWRNNNRNWEISKIPWMTMWFL